MMNQSKNKNQKMNTTMSREKEEFAVKFLEEYLYILPSIFQNSKALKNNQYTSKYSILVDVDNKELLISAFRAALIVNDEFYEELKQFIEFQKDVSNRREETSEKSDLEILIEKMLQEGKIKIIEEENINIVADEILDKFVDLELRLMIESSGILTKEIKLVADEIEDERIRTTFKNLLMTNKNFLEEVKYRISLCENKKIGIMKQSKIFNISVKSNKEKMIELINQSNIVNPKSGVDLSKQTDMKIFKAFRDLLFDSKEFYLEVALKSNVYSLLDEIPYLKYLEDDNVEEVEKAYETTNKLVDSILTRVMISDFVSENL